MTKKKRIPIKQLGRGFYVPSQFVNSWPSILESLDAEIEVLDRNTQKDAPGDFQNVFLTIKRGDASVALQSVWSLSKHKYIVHLQLGSIRSDLDFGKEVEALLISKGFEGSTPPLSDFDDCVDW